MSLLLLWLAASGGLQADAQGDPLPAGAVARLGTRRLRHSDTITAAAFSPDGKVLATGGWDEPVRLWESAGGREILALPGHSGGTSSLAFFPDGRRLASCGGDGKVRLWDLAAARESRALEGQEGRVWAVAVSPDGRRLASTDKDGLIRIWDPGAGKEILRLPGHERKVGALAFSPDGRTLASGGEDQTLRLWETATGKELRRWGTKERPGHQGEVNVVVFLAPDRMASCSDDGTIRLWSTREEQEVLKIEGPGKPVQALAVSPDGRRLASGGFDRMVRVWDAASGRQILDIAGHGGRVWCVAFSPDGRSIASGAEDRRLLLWDASTGREMLRSGHQDRIQAMAFSPDGRRVISGGDDGAVWIWETASGRGLQAPSRHRGGVASVAFSADGARAASLGRDGRAAAWEVSTGRELQSFPPRRGAAAVSFSPEGRLLILEKGLSEFRFRDPADGAEAAETGSSPGSPEHALSPNGRWAVTTESSSSLVLWDTASGKDVLSMPGRPDSIRSMAVSQDGLLLAAGKNDGALCLAAADPRGEFVPYEGHLQGVGSLAFSPDGRMMASGSEDCTVGLWEVPSGREIARFPGHAEGVRCLAFSPDGLLLASGSADTTILVWDVSPKGLKSRPADPPLGPEDLASLWDDLAAADAKAIRAILRLGRAGKEALPFLREKVAAGKPGDEESARIARLIRDLDDDDYKVREKATEDLISVGAAADLPLREAVKGDVTAEVRYRARHVLERIERADADVSGESLRRSRALRILERHGSEEARGMLEAVAKESLSPRERREAAAALERMERGRKPR